MERSEKSVWHEPKAKLSGFTFGITGFETGDQRQTTTADDNGRRYSQTGIMR